MKRLLLLSIIFSLSLQFTFAQVPISTLKTVSADDVTFTEVWALYGETAPDWFTDGSEVDAGSPAYAGVERGIVYSDYSGHVYVSSRSAVDTDDDEVIDTSEPHVYVLDAATGGAAQFTVASLLTDGIRSTDENYGGGYPLNNIATTVDGSIFACNMTLSAGPPLPQGDYELIKAFRVYRWDWEQGIPTMIIDYDEGGMRLGDKFTVTGDWSTEATIYAGGGETTKLLRWKVVGGVVESEPTLIQLGEISTAGTSITVAPVPGKDDWIYVSGKGLLPTLFTTDGTNLSQVAITNDSYPSSLLGGRIVDYGGHLYMGMFSGDQSAFVLDITKHGENVTDVDIIGFTPTFGTKFVNAYGEGAVEFGIIDEELYVFVCAPSNGIACYKIEGLPYDVGTPEKILTKEFGVSVYPNPAVDHANFRFTLPEDAQGPVSLKIYDTAGKFVAIHVDKAQGGQQEFNYNTESLPSGSYIYQIVYNNKTENGQLIIK